LIPEYGEGEDCATPLPDGQAVLEVMAAPNEQSCPRCRSTRVHRSRARSVTERLLRDWKSERLYRCADCNWRGWLVPLEFPAPAAPESISAPDLALLDPEQDELAAAGARSFSPRNLS
jgi:hypothetical protein